MSKEKPTHEKTISELKSGKCDYCRVHEKVYLSTLKQWQMAKIKKCGCYGECNVCSERMIDFEITKEDLR